MFRLLIIIFLCNALVLFAQSPLEIWDMSYLTDASSLNVDTVWASDTVFSGFHFRVAEIRYNSVGDPGEVIRIQAFVAAIDGENLPGIVVGHGNGGEGSLMVALSTAMVFQGIALSISGPGCGESEGQSSEISNWARTYPDPRTSWIYQYACSAIRGVTYLTTLSQVNRDFLCVTGASAGGIMAWLVNGVDSRIRLALPIMATGDWLTAYEESTWLRYYIGDSIPSYDPRVQNMINYLDPIQYAETQHGLVFLVTGAQDEFFPLRCVRNHYNRLNPLRSRLLVLANWDHATYYGADPRYSGRYDAFNNSAVVGRKMLQAELAVFMAAKLAGIVPPIPQVSAISMGNSITFDAIVSPGLQDSVFLWTSTDSGWTFQSHPMSSGFWGRFTYTFTPPPGIGLNNLIYFVESFGTGFVLTSVPYLPEDLPLRIRPPVEETFVQEREISLEDRLVEIEIYPNPSPGATQFLLPPSIQRAGFKIEIYDILGRRVFSGANSTYWNGVDSFGSRVSRGLYFARVKTENGRVASGRFLILR